MAARAFRTRWGGVGDSQNLMRPTLSILDSEWWHEERLLKLCGLSERSKEINYYFSVARPSQ